MLSSDSEDEDFSAGEENRKVCHFPNKQFLSQKCQAPALKITAGQRSLICLSGYAPEIRNNNKKTFLPNC